MNDRALSPEVRLELQIGLDRLKAAEERCREGIRGLSTGALSLEGYLELVRQQRRAQLDWEMRHRAHPFTLES
jgi:hypothetical protein